jgi:hypothetical protein
VLESCVTEIEMHHIENLWNELREYAKDICKKASETPLLPL